MFEYALFNLIIFGMWVAQKPYFQLSITILSVQFLFESKKYN